MNKFSVLIFSLSMCFVSHGRPNPFTYFYKNCSHKSFRFQHNFTSASAYAYRNYEFPIPPMVFPEYRPQVQNAQPRQPYLRPPPVHNTQTRSTKSFTGTNCVFGFCEKADDYPEPILDTILKRSREFDKLFDTLINITQITLDQRFGEVVEQNMCASATNVTYPQLGKNLDDKYRVIANHGSYKQGIVMETCRENTKCEFSETFPLGVETECKQRYTQIRLFALDDNDQPTIDVFPAPSCCVCLYKRIL